MRRCSSSTRASSDNYSRFAIQLLVFAVDSLGSGLCANVTWTVDFGVCARSTSLKIFSACDSNSDALFERQWYSLLRRTTSSINPPECRLKCALTCDASRNYFDALLSVNAFPHAGRSVNVLFISEVLDVDIVGSDQITGPDIRPTTHFNVTRRPTVINASERQRVDEHIRHFASDALTPLSNGNFKSTVDF
ncbi:uncharacterized protein LAESUDRAFT_762601 [Laetiporus sulphureus 93-53]|uniref:Uncharacterized protein n=1 Tax=Laetiporus sulphureus 93-53 TaxID=1314785 RepID=A0A165CFH4_9APHY|nr:uncharacterized protein LAESUDRAFT_762601 [Laetiporus sulphureus 93-53]KZT02715.1 hypothetical protein LAESUDRAFT_762601 [Laetiporus sulphureus 93-53]